MPELTATIPGTPQQQGSKRFFNGRGVDANKNLAQWRADAIWFLQRAMTDNLCVQFTTPVVVEATFVYPRPAAHYGTGRNEAVLKGTAPRWKQSAPDLDKLQRALGDALTQAGVVRDDSLIVRWATEKVWGDGIGCVHLTVRAIRAAGE